MGTLNQTLNLNRTIANATDTSTNSVLMLFGGQNSTVGANPSDALYLQCPTCSLTLQGPNAGDGLGVLQVSNTSAGNLNIKEAGATLNLSAALTMGRGSALTKVGRGTVNVSAPIAGPTPPPTQSSFTFFAVNEGVVNFLPGASTSANVALHVNNLNAGPASAVTANLFTTVKFNGLSGEIAAASTGQNSANVVLHGETTQLQLFFAPIQTGANYRGVISGAGSVHHEGTLLDGIPQTFSGNNTYSATTNIKTAAIIIDGTTSGQGNYHLVSYCWLGGNGTIGLSANGVVSVDGVGCYFSPGSPSQVGTLTIATSGTGGVAFGARGYLYIDVSGNGVSDLLAISGGSINLTGADDFMRLTPLEGGFDGSDYTIATFSQNSGGGVFNGIFGLPSGYAVQ